MNWKLMGVISLLLVLIIFILQNTQVVSVQFLFWKISMSRIILLPVVMSIGFIAGFFVAKKGRRRE